MTPLEVTILHDLHHTPAGIKFNELMVRLMPNRSTDSKPASVAIKTMMTKGLIDLDIETELITLTEDGRAAREELT